MTQTSSKTLLAIDTSTRSVGLALYDGIQLLNETVWTSKNFHTVELAPAIDEAMNKARVSANNLGAVAVALGPGSFTGLRIGLALAKGIALVRRIPIIGIPTLDALAAAQPISDGLLAAVLRAGRGRLAVCWYRAVNQGWETCSKIEVRTPEELVIQILTREQNAKTKEAPVIVCGELSNAERLRFEREKEHIYLASPAFSVRRPGFLAELAWRRWQTGQSDDPASLAPFYLHYNEPIPG